jgi:acyl-CoA synthetase (AMP-forming)/AMP-acid ligase II
MAKIPGRESDTVYRCLAAHAGAKPRAAAIRCKGRADLDYSGLLAAAETVGTAVRGLGLGRNDRVAIVMPNGPEMALAVLGVMSCAAAAPLNPRLTAAEFAYYLADLRAKALLVAHGAGTAAVQVARDRGIATLQVAAMDETRIGGLVLEPLGASLGTHRASHSAAAPLVAAEAGDVALVLHTSGTTARPKLVPLTQANLCGSARNVAQTLRLEPRDSCLGIMPLFHIHGIVAGLLAPLVSGGSVVCAPSLADNPFFVAQVPLWLEAMQPTWYTAVPSMHQAILASAKRHPQLAERCRLRFIRSSSAPLAPSLLHELEAAFRAPVIEAYGMTEAAHQMASNPLPPAARKPGSVGKPAGCEIAVMDADGLMQEAGRKGEIVIRGENVMSAYEANESANRAAFFGEWFRTGDEGLLDADGYLYVTGRLKEIINRGGEKISPREIDEALLEHPAVQQAVAFALPNPAFHEVPAAAVVLKQGHSVEPKALQEFVARKLAGFKVPNPVHIVDEIPKGPTGKLQRIGLAELLASREKA